MPGTESARWRRILRTGWPLGVIVAVPLVIFAPVLFAGYTLYPADLLHEAYLPFAASRSGTNIQVTAIIDLLHEYYPSRVFVRQSLREGRLPLWSPYIYGGHPVFAGNAARATLDPFNLFYFLPDLPTALAWRTFAQVVACALFMYLYLRNLRLGPAAGVLGGLAFALNSMFYANIFDYSVNMLWLSLVLLCIDRGLAGRRLAWFLAAGLVLGVALLSCPLQFMAFTVFAVVALYSLRYLIADRREFRALPYLASIGLVVTIGVLVASVQLLPTLELISVSFRKLTETSSGPRSLTGMVTGTLALVTFVFPNLGGRLKDGMMLAEAWGGTTYFQGYIGVFAFVAAIIAVVCGDRRRTLPYALLGAGSVAMVLYTPLVRFVYDRFFIVYAFAASVLAAHGMQYLIGAGVDAARVKKVLRYFLAFFATVAVGAALWGVVFLVYRGPILEAAEAYLRSILPERYLGNNLALHVRKLRNTLDAFSLLSPATFLPLVGAFAGVWLIKRRVEGRLGGVAFVAAALLLASAELAYSAVTHVPLVSLREYPLFPPTPAVEVMRKDPGLFRVMSFRRYALEPPLLSVCMPAAYGLQTVEGKDPLQPQNLWLILPRELMSLQSTIPTDFRLLNVENVKYVMTGTATTLPERQFELVYDGEVRVFRNRDVMPRAFFVSKYVVARDGRHALELVRGPSFEPREAIILETDPGIRPSSGGADGDVEVRVSRYQPTEVDIDVATGRAGFVVLSDTYYPGWRATVDGHPAEILRANGAMRAVYVMAGRRQVALSYQPASFRIGGIVSGATVALVTAALVAVQLLSYGRQRRRESSRDLDTADRRVVPGGGRDEL